MIIWTIGAYRTTRESFLNALCNGGIVGAYPLPNLLVQPGPCNLP